MSPCTKASSTSSPTSGVHVLPYPLPANVLAIRHQSLTSVSSNQGNRTRTLFSRSGSATSSTIPSATP